MFKMISHQHFNTTIHIALDLLKILNIFRMLSRSETTLRRKQQTH